MRSVITSLAVFILLIVLVCTSETYVKRSADSITDLISKTERIINEKGCEYAISESKELEKLINRKSKWFEAIYEHIETDQLKTHCKTAQSYINSNSESDALAELSVLKMLVNHLPQKDIITFNNFF